MAEQQLHTWLRSRGNMPRNYMTRLLVKGFGTSGYHGMRPQERAPNYPVVLAWGGLLLFIGAGAFAVGMAIHNETLAKQQAPRPEPIYYCATGVEMPAFEPCKEMKDQRDI